MPCKRVFPTFQLLPFKIIYKFFILKFTKNLGGSFQVLYLSLLTCYEMGHHRWHLGTATFNFLSCCLNSSNSSKTYSYPSAGACVDLLLCFQSLKYGCFPFPLTIYDEHFRKLPPSTLALFVFHWLANFPFMLQKSDNSYYLWIWRE